MTLILNFITVLAWLIGGVGTLAVIVNLLRGDAPACLPLFIIICADSWLVARYLL